ncbi:MAG: nickel/cobalt transporter [Thermomicrobiales bacterium]
MNARGIGLTSSVRWRRYRLLVALGALAGLCLLLPRGAAAHPLGNFTINHYSRLEFAKETVQLTYVLDYAEIPTFQQMKQLDTDGDGALSTAEANAYLDANLPSLVANLHLIVAGQAVHLAVADRAASFVPGQGGLPTLRVEAHLTSALPAGWQSSGAATYADGNYAERLGWREIVVQGAAGVGIQRASVPDHDVTNELRTYPANMLTSPLNVTAAHFTLVPGAGGDIGSRAASVPRPAASLNRPTDRVAALITARELTPQVILVSLLLALVWGAAHALTPGHGKTVVAAYLIGSRGTARHAAFLGLTVTVTHTIGVFALGAVTLWLARFLLPETLYPWLNVTSGGLIVVIAGVLVYQRLRGAGHTHGHDHNHTHAHHHHDHPHDHHHEHPATSAPPAGTAITYTHSGTTHTHLPPGVDGGGITWRSLLALGVSGGLIPCPSALVLLLGAIALGRIGFGLLLVVSFSLGLAVVLTAIGLLMVYARRLFDRFSFEARVPRLLPVTGALAMMLAGLGIVLEALRQARVL